MKQNSKKTAYLLFVTIVVFVMAVFSTVSYAWLINYVNGDFRFAAGELDPLTLEIAKIVRTANTTDELTEDDREYTTCSNNKIEANADGTHLGVTLENMSFGAIDNVAQLKPENVVYFRLTVPKSLGDTVKLNFRYTEDDFIVLYHDADDADGTSSNPTQVTDTDLLTNLLALEDDDQVKSELGENNSYLLYQAVVSNTAYEAAAISANFESQTSDTENGTEQFSDADYKKFVTNAVYSGAVDANTLTLKNENINDVADDGYYYVYVKVVPNLALLAHSIEYISDIMPCYMLFKVSATFEILLATDTTLAA